MSREAPYPAWHPVPLARMGSAFLSTFVTLGQVRWDRSAERALQGWSARVMRALGIRVTLARPIPEGGQLWVSNHLSWVDPLIYLSLRPSRILAKAEVESYPGIGPGGRRAGLRFVCRENPFSRAATLRTLRRDLNLGEQVLVFPEGTTTSGDQLAPLYEGSIRMAYRMGVKVLPLRLSSEDGHYPWVGDASLMPHLVNLARESVTNVHVQPGLVLDPRQHPDEDAWVRDIRRQLLPREATLEC